MWCIFINKIKKTYFCVRKQYPLSFRPYSNLIMQYLFLSMKRILYFLLLFSAFQYSAAQNSLREEIVQKLEDDFSKIREKRESTDEIITELQRLKASFSNIGHNEGVLKCNAKLMTNFLKRAEYDKVLELVEETQILALQMKDYKSLSTLSGRLATLHHNTGHYELELKESRKSLQYAKKITDREDRLYQIGFASMQLVCYFRNMGQDSVLHYLRKSLYNFKQMDDSDSFSQKNRRGAMMAVYMDLGNFYNTTTPRKPDIAEHYYLLAYAFKKSDPYIFRDFDLPLLNSMANFYLKKKEYEKAVQFANEALEVEKEEKRPDERIKSFTVLSSSYEKLHKTELQLEYTNKYSKLSDSLNLVEKKTHEKQLKQAVKEADRNNKQKQQHFLRNAYLIGILVIAVFTGALLFLRRKTKFNRAVANNGTKRTDPAVVKIQSDEKKEGTGIFTISDETVNTLLRKLEKFEQSEKFLKNELNLTWLANHLNTNPKYLSEVINRFKGKNFSNYINHLRISYIVAKIKENAAYREYKISYLAQECGYASSQVFVIAFKKETGVPPSTFIEGINKQTIN